MSKVIIRPSTMGGVGVLYPTSDKYLTVDEVKKVVPKGLPFKIIDKELLPEHNEYFNSWEADWSNPDGYGESDDIEKP